MEWKYRPIVLNNWPDDIDYILAIDENGIPNMKGIINAPNNLQQWFTITGIMLGRENFQQAVDTLMEIKNKYWIEGLYNSKRIVFHSRDIRKKTGPFNPKLIDYPNFFLELNEAIGNLEFTIYTSSIDKFSHSRQYMTPFPVYDLCLEFVIERFSFELNRQGKNGLIVMESRGDKENKSLLDSAVSLLNVGNRFKAPEHFKRIKGIYFNPKRTKNNKLSFPQLELADLVSYTIYSYIKTGIKSEAFINIENKVYNYPSYLGYGMKIFPNKYFTELGV